MAWKTITLHGWWVSFKRDSEWYISHKEIDGFSSIDKIEIAGESVCYQDSDFEAVDMGKIISKYPTDSFGLKRCKSRGCYTLKINTREFDPKKLQLHYADVVIKIGNEEIVTGNKIIEHITYNGRKCQLQRVGNDGYRRTFKTTIWHKSPFIYNYCGGFSEGLAAVRLNDWCGYINTSGRVAIPMEWKSANRFHNGLAIVENDCREWGFIDKTGREVIACEYEDVHPFVEDLAYIEEDEDGKTFGFIDRKGNKVIPCIHRNFSTGYDMLEHHDFSCGVALVRNEQYQFGYIDKQGRAITPIVYTWAKPFREGLGAARKDKLAGFIDATGASIIPFMYSAVKSFSNGLAPVKMNGKWGYIDKDNNLVIPCKYDDASGFSDDGLAIIKLRGKEGFIDRYGKIIISPKYTEVWSFSDGVAIVRRGKKEGAINKMGELIIPYLYDWCSNFKNGFAIVEIADKYGCIDKEGNVVIPIIYDNISGPYGDLFAVELYEKMGYIDIKGNILIGDDKVYKALSKKYDQVFIKNGEMRTYSLVLDGKYGLADADGNELIPPRYDWLGNGFYSGLCLAGYRGENTGAGFINLEGEEIIAPKRWTVTDFENGFALVSFESNKWGAINTSGKLIVPCEYEEWKLCVEDDKIYAYDNNDVITIFDNQGNIIEQ